MFLLWIFIHVYVCIYIRISMILFDILNMIMTIFGEMEDKLCFNVHCNAELSNLIFLIGI